MTNINPLKLHQKSTLISAIDSRLGRWGANHNHQILGWSKGSGELWDGSSSAWASFPNARTNQRMDHDRESLRFLRHECDDSCRVSVVPVVWGRPHCGHLPFRFAPRPDPGHCYGVIILLQRAIPMAFGTQLRQSFSSQNSLPRPHTIIRPTCLGPITDSPSPRPVHWQWAETVPGRDE